METVVTRRLPADRAAANSDTHDLPVLATEQAPAVIIPWESLLESGVQPALVLGAERRSGAGR
jgi:hypothetical protein